MQENAQYEHHNMIEFCFVMLHHMEFLQLTPIKCTCSKLYYYWMPTVSFICCLHDNIKTVEKLTTNLNHLQSCAKFVILLNKVLIYSVA